VTDHHIPPEDPPDAAVAVLDPKLWNPDDPLAGVGVAWKFAWAVARELGDPEGKKRLGRLLDLVSVGTVVDIAPARRGQPGARDDGPEAHQPGARRGRRAARHRGARQGGRGAGELDEEDLGWRLGPRLNSIGRIKNPRPPSISCSRKTAGRRCA
jgi:single-stranded-DNA-specific exonuclease